MVADDGAGGVMLAFADAIDANGAPLFYAAAYLTNAQRLDLIDMLSSSIDAKAIRAEIEARFGRPGGALPPSNGENSV